MEISKIRDEMKWVEKVITNKSNTILHYPAIKQLINNFHNKWISKNNTTIVNIYHQYLNLILRTKFGR